MNDPCKLCGKPAEMIYAVDPDKPEIPLCGACFGKWSPRTLDGMLGVRQREYGSEEDLTSCKQEA